VGFEQDLRAYLEERERGSSGDAPVPHVDEHELYRHLLQRLRELASAGAAARVERLFSEWPNKLAQFARYLEAAAGLRASTDAQERMAFAFRALDMALDCLDPHVALVDRLEAERAFAGFVSGLALMESYALENHLVRRNQPHPARLTELGRVFLRLRGKDAVRWLMTCEVAQSYGRRDPWHAPRELFQEANSTHGIEVDPKGGGYNGQTLDRLERLGVLIDHFFEHRSSAEMQDVVQAVLEHGPWHTAVRALLEDERALVLPGSVASATEATIEQTKLIVHEVRNALIPVRYDLEALASMAVDRTQQQHIDGAKQGIASVLNFVDDMVQMSELITEPSVLCEIGAVVDQALRWIDAGRRVQRMPFPAASHVLAPPGRFARAISNVVGNAVQATTAGQPVRLSITHTSGTVRVIVDDGGAGVPVEHRARIFLEGVTMRLDGTGTGFGLAFARRVVEDTVHGKIWCEDSDLGGARFVIEVPEASPE
jgi:signal transduction histidine kinase